MYSEDETHYPGTDDPPAMIWSLCLQKVLVTAKWARRYLGSSLGLCCSAPIRTPWLPMTLRNNSYQLGLFFSDVAIQGEPGFHWAGVGKARPSAASVLPLLWQPTQVVINQRGCHSRSPWGENTVLVMLSVHAWWRFGVLASPPTTPGFMRQTENPRSLASHFLSFFRCLLVVVLFKT